MTLPARIALLLGMTTVAAAVAADPAVPKFEAQEIESGLKVGYAVLLEDLNGDKKPDVIIVDTNRVVWYENPTWKRRTIIGPKTRPDNVCITALDITGDGQLELVLGAGWKPFDTDNPGTLQWLERGKTLDDEWTVHPIPCYEPTVHRVRTADIDGDGKKEIVHAPLMGRGATKANNWTDGRPVRVTAYDVPDNPEKPEHWKPIVLSEELHVLHNFFVWGPTAPNRKAHLLTASSIGLGVIHPNHGTRPGWETNQFGTPAKPTPDGHGASEVAVGHRGVWQMAATIEPWHGNSVVVYTPNSDPNELWDRCVIDEQLRWGHAIAFVDLDGDRKDELIVGVRDDPDPKAGDTYTERRGVRVYTAADTSDTKWDRTIIEDGGVAVEDLAVADLNGDGRPDIVAVGRATGNCRIYWNKAK